MRTVLSSTSDTSVWVSGMRKSSRIGGFAGCAHK
jgi:hypothetical protein